MKTISGEGEDKPEQREVYVRLQAEYLALMCSRYRRDRATLTELKAACRLLLSEIENKELGK